MKVKKLKLKKEAENIVKYVSAFIVVLLCLLIFISTKKHTLQKIGYSKQASSVIVRKLKWNKVKEVGKNKTLNAAFESSSYKEENFDHYKNIKYQPLEDIIPSINKLITKGYTDSQISLILARGNNSEVKEFAKRGKVKYLDEFFSVDYSHLSKYDRYVAYQNKENDTADITVLNVELDFDKDEYQDVEVIDKFSPNVLVNKHHQLSSKYVPKDLINFQSDDVKGTSKIKANKEVVTAFHKMREAAKEDGKDIVVNSGYRSYADQEETVSYYQNAYGDSYVEKNIAKAGYSEHQTGMSIDVASKNTTVFTDSEEYTWMMDNAYKYGFILRYPKSKEDVTLYKCEPWHYRYVGTKIASYIKKNNITYDEYYVMFLQQD